MLKFRDHTPTHHTRYDTGRGIGRRRFLYVTTHNIHKKETSMPPSRFKPTILASERPQTHTLDRAATGVGNCRFFFLKGAIPLCTYNYFIIMCRRYTTYKNSCTVKTGYSRLHVSAVTRPSSGQRRNSVN